VFLYNIDDLQGIVHDNMRSRGVAAELAAAVVETEICGFMAWQRSRAVGPLIRELQTQARSIVEGELTRARGRLSSLTAEQHKAVERVVHGVVQKMLHRPMSALRAAATDDERTSYELVEACQRLFELRAHTKTADHEAEALAEALAGSPSGPVVQPKPTT
jgi:glutamyl-tRNA reductase